MHKFFGLSVVLFLTSLTTYGQTYYTGWDSPTEISDWIEVRKGDQGFYEWIYENNNPLSPDSVLMHYYPVGGNLPTDDWFVSPGFDFFGGGQIDTLWKNFGGFGLPMAGDTIALYLLNGSSDPDLATKTILYNFTDSVYQNDNVWRKDSSISIPPTSGSSYIAFRYYTTNNWLDVKFDNLTITGIPETTSIDEYEPELEISIFPNPSRTLVSISYDGFETQDILNLNLLNASGQIVQTLNPNATTHNISNLAKGLYFVVAQTEQHRIVKSLAIGE